MTYVGEEKYERKQDDKQEAQPQLPILIPPILHDFNFVLLGGDDGKKPFEKGWQNKFHKINDPTLIDHIKSGKNYGVRCGITSPVKIGEITYPLVVLDFDSAMIQEELVKKLPETFTVKTGGKGLYHLYFASDGDKSFKIFDEKMNTLLDIQGEGKQVVSTGSINPKTGRAYSILKDIPVAFISYAELEAILKPYDKSPKKAIKEKKQYSPKNLSEDITRKILDSISMKECLEEAGVDTSNNPTNCPFHTSVHGKCLGWNDETAHCFHCDGSWNKFSLVRSYKRFSDKETFDWLAEKAGMLDELKISRKEYGQKKNEEELSSIWTERKKIDIKINEGKISEEDIDKRLQEEFSESVRAFTDKIDMARQFIKKSPLYYDQAKIWWVWDKHNIKWTRRDDTDILNLVSKAVANVSTVDSKEKHEILEALRQVGRLNTPKPIESSWIQLRDKIIDVRTGEVRKASPEYFVMNPIDWEAGECGDTPTMDKLFREWVGKEWIETLYEIIAFCMIPEYFIHRCFCFLGSGRNGKTSFMNLLTKFIGKDNCCASSLERILNSRFESVKLYKKLVCLMGETNFAELSDDDIFKKLTGSDMVGFEIKGKDPFSEYNYAKMLIATNSLPETLDKTEGFYARWIIIDFPNQFSDNVDILRSIPDQEYKNLAYKCIKIANRLFTTKGFTNQGTIKERAKRYEDRSNPLQKFLDETTTKDFRGGIFKFEFKDRFFDWLSAHGYRIWNDTILGRKMKEKFEDAQTGEKLYRTWMGIRWKDTISDYFNEKNDIKANFSAQNNAIKHTIIPTYSQGSQGSQGICNSLYTHVASNDLGVNPVNPVSKPKNNDKNDIKANFRGLFDQINSSPSNFDCLELGKVHDKSDIKANFRGIFDQINSPLSDFDRAELQKVQEEMGEMEFICPFCQTSRKMAFFTKRESKFYCFECANIYDENNKSSLEKHEKKSDRELQYYESPETVDIKLECSKSDVLEWIRKNPKTSYLIMYGTLGEGTFRWLEELASEGVIHEIGDYWVEIREPDDWK